MVLPLISRNVAGRAIIPTRGPAILCQNRTQGGPMPKNLLLLRLGLAAAISFGAGARALAHSADQDQWSPATLNDPVVAGESFWTEPQSRAELEVGSAAFRLDETTALDI